jgi:signal transduction histidine kinase
VTRLLRSTSVRLALGYALLFILSSGVLGGFLWWRTTGYLDQATDAVIVADTRAVGDRLRDFGLAGAVETVNARVRRAADERAIYLLADPRKQPVTGNLSAWPPDVGDTPGWYMASLIRDGSRHLTRILFVQLPGNYRLLVGRDVEDREALRALVFNALGWAAAAAIALAVLGGFLVRRAALGRIEEINRTASVIVKGDLTRRLPARHGGDDEFDQLAVIINGMLDQIQQLIEGLQTTSHAIAHDLRTPLAELRGRLESLLRRRPPSEAAFEEVQEAVADVDRVIEIFNALLRLAEIDSGVRRSGFRAIDLATVAEEAAELYRPIVEERGATLTVDAPESLTMEGDPFLMAQAIGNLLDNAAKVAPAGTAVTLSLARHEKEIEVSVADRGPGISDAEKPRVTERFFRGDASRGTAGSGLGLSLVAAVARLHGGTLALDDNEPGLRARLVLPTS